MTEEFIVMEQYQIVPEGNGYQVLSPEGYPIIFDYHGEDILEETFEYLLMR